MTNKDMTKSARCMTVLANMIQLLL